MTIMPKSLESSPNKSSKWSAHLIVFNELIVPFWIKSKYKYKVWTLSLLLLTLVGGTVYSLVLLNLWNQDFYNALQNLNRDEFFKQLRIFFLIGIIYSLIFAYKFFVLQKIAVLWRQWLTEKTLTKWLNHKNYYLWHIHPNSMDNPDQRVSEDIRELTDLSLEIGEKVFREFITFVSFIGILWGLSSTFQFRIVDYTVEIPRYLVWVCLLYAFVGTWITHKVGYPLSKLNFVQQKLEADFRYLLVRLRENSESIALLSGENFEKQNLTNKFSQILANFNVLIKNQKNLIFTTNIYGQIAYIFPFLVCGSKVFTKEITLGHLFQIGSAFGQLQGSVSVFVDMYAKIMRLNSVVRRLGGFLLTLEDFKLRELGLDEASPPIHTSGLSVYTPQQQCLIKNLNFDVHPGQRILIAGRSGQGKSTLLRVLNGIWPYTSGLITKSQKHKTLVLSQKPYLPIGSFRDLLTYPETSQNFSEEALIAAMNSAQISHLKKFLPEAANWTDLFSVGEQQRICFARIFIHRPDLVFLDESTSALEHAIEAELFKTLLEKLPNMTLVTFAHSADRLSTFHHQVIEL